MTMTPGPWRKVKDDEATIIVGKPTWPCSRFGKKGEWDVCTIDTGGKDDTANARAIAALPEIVADSIFLLDRLADLEGDLVSDEAGRQYYGHVRPAIVRLRDRLTKAGLL